MESKNKETLRLNGFPSASFPGTPGETGDTGISYLFPLYNTSYKPPISLTEPEKENMGKIYIKNDTDTPPQELTCVVSKNMIHENDYVIYRNETDKKIEFRKVKTIDVKNNICTVSSTPEFSFPMLKN